MLREIRDDSLDDSYWEGLRLNCSLEIKAENVEHSQRQRQSKSRIATVEEEAWNVAVPFNLNDTVSLQDKVHLSETASFCLRDR